MTSELSARFERRFASERIVHGELSCPLDRFHTTVLFGPSGCGKTTVLRCLAGLDRPDEGRIVCDGDVWFDAATRFFRSPQERDAGFLFQDYALFPHLTVRDNIGYGLRRLPAVQRKPRVDELIDRFRLDDCESRFPQQISGGQHQRAALARTVARRPRLLLLDEPLSALDAPLRESLRIELRRLLAEMAVPVILVTHDRIEAMALGDHLIVMSSGRVLESGAVRDVFSRPRRADVARLIGVETIVSGDVIEAADGLAIIDVAGVRLRASTLERLSQRVDVCLRAEDVILLRRPSSDLSVRNQLPATVQWLLSEGPLVRVGLNAGFELTALVTRPACEELQLEAGRSITVGIKAPSVHLISR